MAGDYGKAISIEKAIQNIVSRKYLLPAIQRNFTWSSSQIEVLFDSIMRGYPINTFMFWYVTDKEVKSSFRFYQFLEKYCERFEEYNPGFDTKGHGDFYAVIDGQQRLTSLYIGLKGTYAYKLPRKWWPKTKDDSVLPPRRLYLNLAASLEEDDNEEMMIYEFKFLSNKDLEKSKQKGNKFWFQVGEVLNFDLAETVDDALDIVMDYLDNNNLSDNRYARKTLTRLYTAMRMENTIHFYNETNQNIDHVLDIFIRTNHGGTPLSYSDLLMSIAIANWKKDAREQIDDLVTQVRFGSDMEFSINRDFVLKTALMITGADVKFRVKNFTKIQVVEVEKNWDEIKQCIIETFRLIRSFGLNDSSLRAKNAAIPIAYYIFHKNRDIVNKKFGLYKTINNQAKYHNDKREMQIWLRMSLLKGVFGGQGDSILIALRKILKENMTSSLFPRVEIINAFRGKRKDIVFDDDFIDGLLKTQKDDSACFSILALLLPDLDYSRSLHKDHLHPESAFKNLDQYNFLKNDPNKRTFFGNPENWNSILNLHLLDASKNISKLATPLETWFNQQSSLTKDMLLIPDRTSLKFENFEDFISDRYTKLKTILHDLSGSTK